MTLAILLAALVLAGVLLFAGYYFSILRPRKNTLDWVALQEREPLTLSHRRRPMEKKDALPILIITVLYAFTAFFSLGDMTAPQSYHDFAAGDTLTAQLSQPVTVQTIRTFPTLGTGSYNLEISSDGEHWSTLWTRTEKDQWDRDETVYYWADAQDYSPSYALPQSYDLLLAWHDFELDNPLPVQYLRLTGKPDWNQTTLRLNKFILLGEDGAPLPLSWTGEDGAPLPDDFARMLAVDDTVPAAPSWRNGAYFDEIYHPRTALEHLENIPPYEVTHPPLGKLIIGLGMRLFGVTPFGWRCMGVLFGVLMVPLLYIFLKNFFGKTVIAACGATLLSSEFMHLTQTRLATIDTYGTFFILLSYFFFYRWLSAPATPDKKGKVHGGYLSLALSGLSFGLGVASKWTVFYAGAGLAVLYLIHFILRLRAWPKDPGAPKRWKWIAATLTLSVVCFVLLPLVIYTASYIPYALADGMTDFSLSNTLSGFGKNLPVLLKNLSAGESTASFDRASLSGIMLDNQWYMLHYHSGVHSTHPYSSSWFQWIVDGRPILYYLQNLPGDTTQRFAAFNNPILSWAGLLAVLSCLARCFRRMWAKLTFLGLLGAGACGLCVAVGRVENGAFDPALPPAQLGVRLAGLILGLLVYLAVAGFIALHTEERQGGQELFISMGFLAQFAPWLLVGRTTFAYHYFPSTLFLIFALCLTFRDLMDSPRATWKLPVYGITGGSVALYLLFYPGLTGLTMPVWYSGQVLRFLPSWPF